MSIEYNRKIEEIRDPKARKEIRELRYSAVISQEEYDRIIDEQISKEQNNNL